MTIRSAATLQSDRGSGVARGCPASARGERWLCASRSALPPRTPADSALARNLPSAYQFLSEAPLLGGADLSGRSVARFGREPAEEAALEELWRRREHIESALIVLLRSQLRRARGQVMLPSRAGSAVDPASSSQKFPPAARQQTAAVRRVPRRKTGLRRAKKCPPNSFYASACKQLNNQSQGLVGAQRPHYGRRTEPADFDFFFSNQSLSPATVLVDLSWSHFYPDFGEQPVHGR